MLPGRRLHSYVVSMREIPWWKGKQHQTVRICPEKYTDMLGSRLCYSPNSAPPPPPTSPPAAYSTHHLPRPSSPPPPPIFSHSIACCLLCSSGAGHLSGLLLPHHGGVFVCVQHVQGAESEGGDGLPGGAATGKLVRDDVARRAGGRIDGVAPGLLIFPCFLPGG